MESKDIGNISDYFTQVIPETDTKRVWEHLVLKWIDRIAENKEILNLFELKLWLESLDAFFTSTYSEKLILEQHKENKKNYAFYLSTFTHIITRIISLIKSMNYTDDKFKANFEEFIIERISESGKDRSINSINFHTPEESMQSLNLFLQNLKVICAELLKEDTIPLKTFLAVKKLYNRELQNNPTVITLKKKSLFPKIDKVFQPDISEIILKTSDKDLRKNLGIFFILTFRVLKINNFIEQSLNKSRNMNVVIPLILALGNNIEFVLKFYKNSLSSNLKQNIEDKQKLRSVEESFNDFKLEYKKIYQGELPYFFNASNVKINRRKLLRNIVIISEIAIQEAIEIIANLFNEELRGPDIFENYISRQQKSQGLVTKLTHLHRLINDYMNCKSSLTPSDIFFEINLFIETDLNYLLYKDWNELLRLYNNLSNTGFTKEFERHLLSFHSFITRILKEIVKKRT